MELKVNKRFPVLNSKRTHLREVTNADAAFIHFMRSDAKVNEFVDRPRTRSIADASFFIEQRAQDYFYKRSIYWGIALKTNGFMIGSITLWKLDLEEGQGELGFDLHPSFQGRGYMSEAVTEVLDFGFDMLKLHTIVALTSPQNLPSQRLLERFHFTRMKEENLSEMDQLAGLYGYQLLRK